MSALIISATNRPDSNSFIVSQILQKMYKEAGAEVEIFSLEQVPFEQLLKQPYPKKLPPDIKALVSQLNQASGFSIVCPEYNGSFPGIFKFFIDHWSYPETFEFRPMAFVGLGGLFGGLRSVEQMQQIMGYRNAFIYPERIFLQNISSLLSDKKINNPKLEDLLRQQVKNFLRFIEILEKGGLAASVR